jgi:hypothetical protein
MKETPGTSSVNLKERKQKIAAIDSFFGIKGTMKEVVVKGGAIHVWTWEGDWSRSGMP